MSLITRFPLWLIIFAIALGVAYALFLYFRNKNINFEKKQRIVMASLRGVAMSLIAFLLLAPMLKMIKKEVDKPIIIIAADNSESLKSCKDSAFYLSDYQKNLQSLIDDLEKDYEVKTYISGSNDQLVDDNKISLDFSEKSTNLASIFNEIDLLYANRNVGALIMLTDGIYNQSSNPYYLAQKVSFPIYTVGLGSDEQTKDLYIADIVHNKEAFKGNRTPVEIKIRAGKLTGKTAELKVNDNNGNTVFSKNLQISGNNYFETVSFFVDAQNTGLQSYSVSLQELDGEVTHKNNHARFYIKVVESKEKIAIVYNSPHPDIAAIRSALELSENYDIQVSAIQDFNSNPADYDLMILHQLPSQNNQASSLLQQIKKSGTSVLYIIGNQTNLNALNNLNAGLQITQTKSLSNSATPSFNNNFMSFTFSDESQEVINTFPPLQTPFGTYKSAVSANTFMMQKISGVETNYPLILFNETNGVKSGFICGTGIWSWKVYNFVNKQNHDAFNDIIGKIALFLENTGDKSPFKIRNNLVFAENASVEFFAELHNDAGELVNTPDVKMTITGRGDTTYDAQFSKQNNAYYLNMGELPTGTYKWTAKTQLGNKNYEKSGSFSVQENFIETSNLVADFDLLKNISQTTNGKFFNSNDLEKIAKEIRNNENVKPIATYNKKYSLLLDSPWYLAAIILLLAIEWFLRKWHGGY